MPQKQVLKPLEDLPRRAKLYAEFLSTGLSMAAAAREAGYSAQVAKTQSYAWIGKTREDSYYPALFDYDEQLRKEKLRLFEVSAETIVSELKLVAFSSIENYLDLPQRRVRKKYLKLQEQERELSAELDKYTSIVHNYERQIARGRNKPEGYSEQEDPERVGPKITRDAYEEALAEAQPIKARLTKTRADIRKVEDSPGYTLRLKFLEDIPKELLPAVAEIRETREGIAVKLHSKMDALDKLARWQKMYTDNAQAGDDAPETISEINVNVNGSRSTLRVA
jgi:hypothetical protein